VPRRRSLRALKGRQHETLLEWYYKRYYKNKPLDSPTKLRIHAISQKYARTPYNTNDKYNA